MRLAPLLLAALGLAGAPLLADPGPISVASFLAKADALMAKGPMALFSPDVKLLRGEAEAAIQLYKQRLHGEKAAGQPSSCPPERITFRQSQMLSHLRQYPATVRPVTSLRSAIADLVIKTWPCPG